MICYKIICYKMRFASDGAAGVRQRGSAGSSNTRLSDPVTAGLATTANRLRAVHGLRQTAADQPPEAAQEHLALLLGEDGKDILAHAVEYLLNLVDLVLSGCGDDDEPGAAIGAQRSALGQAGGLQFIQRDHHRGLVDADQP